MNLWADIGRYAEAAISWPLESDITPESESILRWGPAVTRRVIAARKGFITALKQDPGAAGTHVNLDRWWF